MHYREYGKTGKKTSLLGFGGMRFRPEDLTDKAGLNRCAEAVRFASELGINYFDTAPGYCNGKSEEIFGIAFKEMPHPFFVSTKSSIASDKTAGDVLQRIRSSLHVMGVPKIHFFHMWSILDLDQYQKIMAPGGPYEGAVQAKELGLIDHICFSTHCPPDDIIKIIKDGFFNGVTISFNVINYGSMLDVLEAAGAAQMGVATMNSLGGGIIPQNPEYFSDMVQSSDNDVIEAALRFNASFKEISVILSGMTNREEVAQNAQAFSSVVKTYHPYEREVTELSFSSEKLCSGCGYCRECPAGISIPEYMQAYNYRFFPKSDFMGMTFDWFDEEKKIANIIFQRLRVNSGLIPLNYNNPCIECGRCEDVCTQHIPIIERINHIYHYSQKNHYCLESIQHRFEKIFLFPNMTKIGIYPAGPYTESIIGFLIKNFTQLPFQIFIFDKNQSLWGKKFFDITINPPDDIVSMGIEKLVIAHIRYQNEMYNQLKKLKEYGIIIELFHNYDDISWFN
ncbi:aldo/keto reductase [Methanospirillum sp. J.3.6.1-F.2.7.3]|uniref:Aldo/keto reductase n=1 Tax=Methanospirillum purgamenti TaxID=2834276 RepID=A0A8E7B158_9EURY|nr:MULTISPECIES: aldo/keto reductase [Methanospirillum]MDX8551892.1 aldo/keto reductase [Methanospirillum hungatei]QVV89156.1 aldo/keto reductase [Methanospirillum sp. J.3.6.1-F.2.7.3]